jgi:hypothetical protein
VSHWTVARVSISKVDRQVLERALRALAEKLGTSVQRGFYVKGHRGGKWCEYALPANLPYGNAYGVSLEGGLTVYVDDFGAAKRGLPTAEEFARMLHQLYVAAAVASAAEEMGMKVEACERGEGAIELLLVR